jgi:hypothetical protein
MTIGIKQCTLVELNTIDPKRENDHISTCSVDNQEIVHLKSANEELRQFQSYII